MNNTYDFAIIGSGVGGGRLAHILSEACLPHGLKGILLEAGHHWKQEDFPFSELHAASRLYWNGGLEWTTDARIGLLRGRALGGTSVVNQALLSRIEAPILEEWIALSRNREWTLASFEKAYERALGGIAHEPIAERFQNTNAQIFKQGMNRQSYGWAPVVRAQKDCAVEHGSDCLACLGGCPRGSKQSTLAYGIPEALALGLDLKTGYHVDRLERIPGGVKVFGKQNSTTETVSARKVILAAGSLGTAGILLRSKETARLPALGRKFTCHPQTMTYALYENPVEAHRGSFQSVHSKDFRFRRFGYKLENVFAGPVSMAMLLPDRGFELRRKMSRFRYFASIEVCLRDEPTGRIRLDGKGRPTVHKKLSIGEMKKKKDGLRMVRELFEATEAREIVPCEQAFGLHLMGGASLGSDASSSVVNPDYELHDWPQVSVVDSSLFPSASGSNPSLTIMALAGMASEKILRELKR